MDARPDTGLVDRNVIDALDGAPPCDIAKPFGVPTLVAGGVNSSNDDFAPRLSADAARAQLLFALGRSE
jgi:hypothetical protein